MRGFVELRKRTRRVAYALSDQYKCLCAVWYWRLALEKSGDSDRWGPGRFGGRNLAHDFGRKTACERRDGIKMSFVLFLRGLIGVLLVFAITTYVITQSLWTTFVQTLICAVLLQIGYFAAVLFLVWRSADKAKEEGSAEKDDALPNLPKEDHPAGKVSQLPGVPRSGHL